VAGLNDQAGADGLRLPLGRYRVLSAPLYIQPVVQRRVDRHSLVARRALALRPVGRRAQAMSSGAKGWRRPHDPQRSGLAARSAVAAMTAGVTARFSAFPGSCGRHHRLSNLNTAMRGGVLDLIEVGLFAVGAGRRWTLPTRRRSSPGSRS
jgi:hypothetical protein